MRQYLVDFVFLPDRDSGVQVEVTAADQASAVVAATAKLARDIESAWSFELDTVTEA